MLAAGECERAAVGRLKVGKSGRAWISVCAGVSRVRGGVMWECVVV